MSTRVDAEEASRASADADLNHELGALTNLTRTRLKELDAKLAATSSAHLELARDFAAEQASTQSARAQISTVAAETNLELAELTGRVTSVENGVQSSSEKRDADSAASGTQRDQDRNDADQKYVAKDDVAVLLIVTALITVILAVALTIIVLRCAPGVATPSGDANTVQPEPAAAATVLNPTFDGDKSESVTDGGEAQFEEVTYRLEGRDGSLRANSVYRSNPITEGAGAEDPVH